MKCNCKFPTGKIDYENVDYNCPKTWALFQSGKTKGIFQLETNLGKKWSKEVKPSNIEELSALISIMRPGTLKSILDGKSMTQRYSDRKNGLEPTVNIDDSISSILEPTCQILVYQEQIMAIAQKIAGFDLKEADELRKGVGKKDAALLTKVGEKFLQGCEKTGIVTKEKAEEIWSYIVKSARYLFNKSHAVSYSILAYQTAYAKAHFPYEFYTAWLSLAKEKIDPQKETAELVSDAKSSGIQICVPNILYFKYGRDFLLKDKKIYFGPRNVKGVGDSHVEKLVKTLNDTELLLKLPVNEWKWIDFLLHVSNKISKTVATNLILAGSLDCFKLSRKSMLYEVQTFSELTPKEQMILQNHRPTSLLDGLNNLVNQKINKNRHTIIESLINVLKNPTSSLEDTPLWINKTEIDLLGVPISCQKIDSIDFVEANTTCKEFLDGKNGEMTFCVEIKSVNEYTISKGKSKGQKMCFLEVEDGSCDMGNIAVFSKEFEEHQSLLYPGNLVALFGKRSKQNSLVVSKIKQL